MRSSRYHRRSIDQPFHRHGIGISTDAHSPDRSREPLIKSRRVRSPRLAPVYAVDEPFLIPCSRPAAPVAARLRIDRRPPGVGVGTWRHAAPTPTHVQCTAQNSELVVEANLAAIRQLLWPTTGRHGTHTCQLRSCRGPASTWRAAAHAPWPVLSRLPRPPSLVSEPQRERETAGESNARERGSSSHGHHLTAAGARCRRLRFRSRAAAVSTRRAPVGPASLAFVSSVPAQGSPRFRAHMSEGEVSTG